MVELDATIAAYSIRHRLRYGTRPVKPETEAQWKSIFRSLNHRGSPGLGLFSRYSSIKDVLGWDGFTCTNTANCELLKHAVSERLDYLASGVSRTCFCGFCSTCPSDLKLMIKMEPHKPEKIAAGRLRLISVLSLVDQVVDRCLFGGMVRAECSAPFDNACKSGWTPLPQGFADIHADFAGEVLATDCSAFDWTFPSWLVEPLLQSRLENFRELQPGFETACHRRWQEVLSVDCVIRLPCGQRLRQTVPGIMKSGWLLTISVNSQAQEFISRVAWSRCRKDEFPLLWAMGDDVLMRWSGGDPARFVRCIRQLGILTKMATHSREFAGFSFPQSGSVEPLYPAKHKFILGHVPLAQLEEVCSGYGLLYALSEQPWADEYIIRHSRWTRRSCRAWAMGTISLRASADVYDAMELYYGFWD